jgi:type III secretion protein Q
MPQPYPFSRLPKSTCREVTALRCCARQIPQIDLDFVRATAEKLLGTSIAYAPGCFEWCGHGAVSDRLIGPTVAVVLERGSGGAANRLLLDLSPQLVAAAVDRVLGGRGEQAIGNGIFPLDDLSRGVFAYAVARILNAVRSNFLLRDVLTETDAVREILGLDGAGVWPIEVRMGAHIGRLRLWIPHATSQALRPNVRSRIPDALARIEVTLIALAGDLRLDRSDLDSLQQGDVVFLDRCELYQQRCDWLGRVDLVIDGGKRAVWRCAVDGQNLQIESMSRYEEQVMGKGETQTLGNPEELTKLAGDVPIEVSVEIARFTLALEEIGGLRAGEILSTGCPIGERVTLRVGGLVIASGELVDVEGDVGVRILSTCE